MKRNPIQRSARATGLRLAATLALAALVAPAQAIGLYDPATGQLTGLTVSIPGAGGVVGELVAQGTGGPAVGQSFVIGGMRSAVEPASLPATYDPSPPPCSCRRWPSRWVTAACATRMWPSSSTTARPG
ncbi:MAG: hypothetical protein HZY78_06870 [Burkholderiaceae bacterium]|nr:MAG: hypothetical protein HZY78_06870 [Burkholderiaceae bacterium]